MTAGPREQTPAQTIGPFFHGMLRPGENVIAPDGTEGERIRLQGRVLDRDAQPVGDALVELWQADHRGRYHHPLDHWPTGPHPAPFIGYGRCPTDPDTGEYAFDTIRPGPVGGAGGEDQAPHVALIVHARGVLNALHTRAYLVETGQAAPVDPVIAVIPTERRTTLVARPAPERLPPTYRFDIRLQGDGETAFFEL